MKTNIFYFLRISHSVLLRMNNFFFGKFVEKIKTHILCSVNPPHKIVPFMG